MNQSLRQQKHKANIITGISSTSDIASFGPDSSNVLALMLYSQTQVPSMSKPMWRPRKLVMNFLPT